MPFKLQTYGVSDIGLVRANNEDMWAELPECQFFALADGMGGHRAGEVAAQEAINKLLASIEDIVDASTSVADLSDDIRKAVIAANDWVYRLAKKEEAYNGMGTTLCCFLLYQETLIYAHVGDSRIYRFRKHNDKYVLERLTIDHSLRSELIAKGELDEKSAASFPYKNIITRAIGTASFVEPDVNSTEVQVDDIYFMCSDGLSDYVDEKKIASIIENATNVKTACNNLVKAANANGGNDNITIVMIKISE